MRQVQPAMPSPPGGGRVAGLDGMRGLAALYVVIFHCWLLTFHGFPANHGPSWLGWLRYGHLAVVFFLVCSGFSLAVTPALHGWRLAGVARYARRRAWRILPPYWAALVFSLAIAWAVTPQPHSGPPTGTSVVVYGLLLQDFVVTPPPNGAFWSIAVEAELYVAFPLLLLVRRRAGAAAVLAAVTVPVVAWGLVAPRLASVSPVDKLSGLTAQLAPLFTMGMVAAGVLAAPDRVRRLPWHWLAALAALPAAGLLLLKGTVWTVHHLFWIDLAVGPAIALLLAGVATGRSAPLLRLLTSRPVRRLGDVSYSLYLVQLPIVAVISRRIAAPYLRPGLPSFLITLVLAVPTCLLIAGLFATFIEAPSRRYRSWSSWKAAAQARVAPVRPTTDPVLLHPRSARRSRRPTGADGRGEARAPTIG